MCLICPKIRVKYIKDEHDIPLLQNMIVSYLLPSSLLLLFLSNIFKFCFFYANLNNINFKTLLRLKQKSHILIFHSVVSIDSNLGIFHRFFLTLSRGKILCSTQITILLHNFHFHFLPSLFLSMSQLSLFSPFILFLGGFC